MISSKASSYLYIKAILSLAYKRVISHLFCFGFHPFAFWIKNLKHINFGIELNFKSTASIKAFQTSMITDKTKLHIHKACWFCLQNKGCHFHGNVIYFSFLDTFNFLSGGLRNSYLTDCRRGRLLKWLCLVSDREYLFKIFLWCEEEFDKIR